MEPGRRLGATLGRTAPRLDRTRFSESLCDLVAFVLETKPRERPSMEAVLEQDFIANSDETHPTTSLAELVRTYYRWERSGGHRHSLFFPGGAPAVEYPESLDSEGSWNFSLTEDFEQDFVEDENLSPTSNLTPSINAGQVAATTTFDSYPLSPTPVVYTPATSPRPQVDMSNPSEAPNTMDLTTPEDTFYIEERVKRGQQAMQGLFDEKKASYKYEVKNDFKQQRARQPMVNRLRSDLPLRHETEQSSLSHNELEVRAHGSETDSYGSMPNIDLANVNTIKANRMHRFMREFEEEEKDEPQYGHHGADKRATLDFGWTFPQGEPAPTTTDTEAVVPPAPLTVAAPPPVPSHPPVLSHPPLLRVNTAPVSHLINESRQSVIDLDELYDSDALGPAPTSRGASDEEQADPVSHGSDAEEADEAKSTTTDQSGLAFDYGPSNAEISEHSTTSSDNEAYSGDEHDAAAPPRPQRRLVFPEVGPPSAAAMMEGASAADVTAELRRMLSEWTVGLGVLGEAFGGSGGEPGVGEEGEEGGEGEGEGEEEEEEEEE